MASRSPELEQSEGDEGCRDLEGPKKKCRRFRLERFEREMKIGTVA